MGVLDTIAASFENRSRHYVDVPEWGADPEKPFRVWFKTPNAATLSAAEKESEGDKYKFLAIIVGRMAQNENETQMFNKLDWHDLMTRVSPDGLARVANAILSYSKLDTKAAEKN